MSEKEKNCLYFVKGKGKCAKQIHVGQQMAYVDEKFHCNAPPHAEACEQYVPIRREKGEEEEKKPVYVWCSACTEQDIAICKACMFCILMTLDADVERPTEFKGYEKGYEKR
jgi:hypothetical protein